jgi:hypothetical protein
MSYNKETQLYFKLKTFVIYNIVGAIILLYTILHQYQNYHKNNNDLKIQEYNLTDLNKNLEKINFSLNIVSEARAFSNEISSNVITANGIQYKVAQERMTELVKHYKIYPSSTFFASNQINIPELIYSNNLGTFNLVGSHLKLAIDAGTDLQIIQFLETMNNYFPGFLKIEYLRLKKVSDIDVELVEDIKNKINRVTVKADVGIEWYDFKKAN